MTVITEQTYTHTQIHLNYYSPFLFCFSYVIFKKKKKKKEKKALRQGIYFSIQLIVKSIHDNNNLFI